MAHQETPHPEQHLDEWHSHGPEEGVPQVEHGSHVNMPIMFLVFVAMVVTVGVLVIALTLFYNSTSAQLAAVRLESTAGYAEEYVPYREAAKAQITGFHADDPDAGTVRIPVDRAFDTVIEQYND
ncbi:MAG: hypothetical protein AAFN41_00890 [Planctomycetota bacterium]